MKTELPNFLLKTKFPNYYLLLDSEIIKNENFSKKIQSFSESIKGKIINVEVIIPTEYDSLNLNSLIKIPNTDKKSLDIFYQESFNIGNSKLSAYLFDFIIYDDTCSWELYCSLSYELGILGCVENITHNVLDIINPYEEMSLQAKLEEIGGMFNNEISKDLFISNLVKIYSL